MSESDTTPPLQPPRLNIRQLDLSKKALIVVILGTVGFGYLAALANLFASHSANDGKASLKLGDIFYAVFDRQEPWVETQKKLEESLGVDDVVYFYHGNRDGNRMCNSLDGVMGPIMLEEFGNDQAEVDRVFGEIKWWSELKTADQRKAAYEIGIPLDPDSGEAQRDKFFTLFQEGSLEKEKKKDPDNFWSIKQTFADNCVYCHASDSDNSKAKHFPLSSFEDVDVYNKIDTGVSFEKLALTTHVHLLGFSVLFAMTGFLFSMTTFPLWFRTLIAPATLFLQISEIACWWLSKIDVFFAHCIFYLGPLIAITLLIQIFGTLGNMLWPSWGKKKSAEAKAA